MVESAECSGDNGEIVKGEKEKVKCVKDGDGAKCCGDSGEVVKGEKEKEKVDVTPSGSVGGASSECGIWQMSRETLRNIRKHLGDGRGECCISVVVYKYC